MNTITLVLVLVLTNGTQAELQYSDMFPNAETCTAHAIDAGKRFVRNEHVERVDYYCIKVGEEM